MYLSLSISIDSISAERRELLGVGLEMGRGRKVRRPIFRFVRVGVHSCYRWWRPGLNLLNKETIEISTSLTNYLFNNNPFAFALLWIRFIRGFFFFSGYFGLVYLSLSGVTTLWTVAFWLCTIFGNVNHILGDSFWNSTSKPFLTHYFK